jgi:hypothetical protein
MSTHGWPKRIITRSDRLMVCRNPVAVDYEELDAIDQLNKIRNWFYKFQKENKNEPASRIGYKMYTKMQKYFGNYDESVVFSERTDYNVNDCQDWWDLADTEKIEICPSGGNTK